MAVLGISVPGWVFISNVIVVPKPRCTVLVENVLT